MTKYIKNRKGYVGIGTLILFIAMMLIAAIVASVLINISNLLQLRTSYTGRESTEQVVSGIVVLEIWGYHQEDTIKYLGIFVTPSVGSIPIDLSQAVVMLNAGKNEMVARYNKNVYIEDNRPLSDPNTLSKLNTLDYKTFGIIVIRDLDNSCQKESPIINKGDIVAIVLNTTKLDLKPGTTVSGTIQPGVGTPGIVSFTTPPIYLNETKLIQLQ